MRLDLGETRSHFYLFLLSDLLLVGLRIGNLGLTFVCETEAFDLFIEGFYQQTLIIYQNHPLEANPSKLSAYFFTYCNQKSNQCEETVYQNIKEFLDDAHFQQIHFPIYQYHTTYRGHIYLGFFSLLQLYIKLNLPSIQANIQEVIDFSSESQSA